MLTCLAPAALSCCGAGPYVTQAWDRGGRAALCGQQQPGAAWNLAHSHRPWHQAAARIPAGTDTLAACCMRTWGYLNEVLVLVEAVRVTDQHDPQTRAPARLLGFHFR